MFCDSHYISRFATFFIDARAKRSFVESFNPRFNSDTDGPNAWGWRRTRAPKHRLASSVERACGPGHLRASQQLPTARRPPSQLRHFGPNLGRPLSRGTSTYLRPRSSLGRHLGVRCDGSSSVSSPQDWPAPDGATASPVPGCLAQANDPTVALCPKSETPPHK